MNNLMFKINVNIAQELGQTCATVFQYIFNWVEFNKSNNSEKHFKNDRYWTYASVKDLSIEFPHLTTRQINYALNKLKTSGLIISENFNNCCSRTLWYSYTEKAVKLMSIETTQNACEGISEEEKTPETEQLSTNFVNTILQNCQNDLTKLSNLYNTIPTNNTYSNLEKETHKEKDTSPPDCVCEIVELWNFQNISHCELTPKLVGIVLSLLETHTIEQIKASIVHYASAINDQGYFMCHRWTLVEFLTKPNALVEFLDTGNKWLSYCAWLARSKPNKEQMLRNDYSKEQLNALITNLDEVEI